MTRTAFSSNLFPCIIQMLPALVSTIHKEPRSIHPLLHEVTLDYLIGRYCVDAKWNCPQDSLYDIVKVPPKLFLAET